MIPLLVLLWQSDATARLALSQSLLASINDLGRGALMTSGEASVDARALGELSTYSVAARGLYGRAFDFSSYAGSSVPTNNLSAAVSGDAGFQLTPRLHLGLTTQNYLASRFGVRAFDELAPRDPFLEGDRLQYSTGGSAGLTAVTSRRSSLRASAGYTQMGAFAASSPEAVGVDTHALLTSAAYSYALGRNDTLTPELRYSFTHFYHAVYGPADSPMPPPGPSGMTTGATTASGDAASPMAPLPGTATGIGAPLYLRGPADIHAVTALLGERHDVSRRLVGEAQAGATVATAPPMLPESSAVIAPLARLSIRYLGPRYRLHASYGYSYTLMGPRVGFGGEHQAIFEVSFRPVRGSRYRDLQLVGIGRAAIGSALVALSSEERAGEMRPSGKTAMLHTTSVAAGALVAYPLLRGLSLTGGWDLQYLRGVFDPSPPGGAAPAQIQTLVSVGIAGVLSTDPGRTVLRDLEDEEDDARRLERGGLSAGERRALPPAGGLAPRTSDDDDADWVERNLPRGRSSLRPEEQDTDDPSGRPSREPPP